jgi:hypothetical protein
MPSRQHHHRLSWSALILRYQCLSVQSVSKPPHPFSFSSSQKPVRYIANPGFIHSLYSYFRTRQGLGKRQDTPTQPPPYSLFKAYKTYKSDSFQLHQHPPKCIAFIFPSPEPFNPVSVLNLCPFACIRGPTKWPPGFIYSTSRGRLHQTRARQNLVSESTHGSVLKKAYPLNDNGMTSTKKTFNKIGTTLIANKQTISVAESVTAGAVQRMLSRIPDAADFFQGGLTAYSIGQKYKHLNVTDSTYNLHPIR